MQNDAPIGTAMSSDLRHFTSIRDIDSHELISIFEQADGFREYTAAVRRHQDRVVGLLFYEPSTRTRLSFASACCRLGAQHIGFDSPDSSSVAKGESLVDTIRAVQRYCDVIVLRHPCDGAARLASTVAMVPIINGGDGAHEHPTQTLCDAYSIWQRFGSLEGRTVGIMGDLRYGRTAHSLAIALAPHGVTLVCIAPDEFQMPKQVLDQINAPSTYRLEPGIDDVIPELDVLYLTRLQKERFTGDEGTNTIEDYPFDADKLTFARSDLLIMHPLPRDGEVPHAVDDDSRSWYFEQVANGVPIRMALLDRVLDELPPPRLGARQVAQTYEAAPWRAYNGISDPCPNSKCITRHEREIVPRWTSNQQEELLRCYYCDHEYTAKS